MLGMSLKHWSVHPGSFGEKSDARAKWELEERINFGIGAAHIAREALKNHWDTLDIDPWKRKALFLALE